MALIQTDHNGTQNGLINTLHGGVRTDCAVPDAALPRAFLHSLRTLFDILDDQQRGFVHLSEIESRWRGAGERGLPAGVLESLRRVAPVNGCLSFERFVAGLRNSMFVPETGSRPAEHPQWRPGEGRVRPLGPSNGINTLHNRQPGRGRPRESSAFTDKLAASSRYSAFLVASRSCGGTESSYRYGQDPLQPRSIDPLEHPEQRNESAGLPRSRSETVTGFMRSRRHTRSRDEQRRHTVTSGVDYGLLKQMKELEQEKDSLLAGMDVLDQAREWFQTQIHNIMETQRLIGQNRHTSECSCESTQSRLDVLLPKLQDVSRCLNELISCSGKTLPSTAAPYAGGSPSAAAPPQAIHTLKEHNRLLTQEVTEKSERISQLEQEKCALIKQLFEARAHSAHDSSALDSTFI
ncbi:suppressor APC domain-containing protein 2 isoform X2 [Danio aesculapii]|uniref:suppressor APC domain-containing protein 2 isoform X2 n=1 Tax=Danio aesculapii TaxID=1142201 RepID=UPI0024C02D50|nr:suppressor APC domain-containing protein 2 isoform X2 [Danio aesculapii]